jgi:hypothetical protein
LGRDIKKWKPEQIQQSKETYYKKLGNNLHTNIRIIEIKPRFKSVHIPIQYISLETA